MVLKWQAREHTLISKLKRPVLAVFLGVLLVFLAAEIFFRLFAPAHQAQADPVLDPDMFRIAVVGNSHTAGLEVLPKERYSAVLEQFLRSEAPGKKVQVYNFGSPNANTNFLYYRMKNILKKIRPQLIIYLGGEPNLWNNTGYLLFLEQNQKVSAATWLREAALSLAMHSRLIRWLLMLSHLPQPVGQIPNEKTKIFLAMAGFERYPTQLFSSSEIRDLESRIINFLRQNPLSPSKRMLLNLAANLRFFRLNNKAGAFALLEESIRLDPKTFDVESVDSLKRFGGDKTLEALAGRVSPPKMELKILEEARRTSQIEFQDDESTLTLLHKFHLRYPWNTRIAQRLARQYEKAGNFGSMIEVVDRYVRANPLQDMQFDLTKFLELAYDSKIPAAKKVADDLVSYITEQFPTEKRRVSIVARKDFKPWLIWDIGRTIDEVRREGSTIVVQNYHPILSSERLNPIIEEAARIKGADFLDTYSVFSREVERNPDPRAYYSNMHGMHDKHPGTLGHRLFARIIYDHLNEKKLLPPEFRGLDSKKIIRFAGE